MWTQWRQTLRKHSKPFGISIGLLGILLTLGLGGTFVYEVQTHVHLITPPATPLFEDRYGQFLAEGGASHSDLIGFWDLPEGLPPRITRAMLAIEDKRFYEHSGIDVRSLVRAFVHNLSHSTRQGASTIAMQVARLQHPRPRTYWNKLVEMGVAWHLISQFGHESVLRHYLKLLPQGNRIHGVAYAARRYFRKPLADLSWAESAILAALPKSPTHLNPYKAPGFERVTNRAQVVLKLLVHNGTLSQEDYQASLRQLKRMAPPVREIRPSHSYHAILRIQQKLTPLPNRKTYTRSLRTGIDLELQEKLAALANEAMDRYRPLGAGNVAIVVASKESGLIRGYVGSHSYHDALYSGAINYATTPRSSGSTLKPLIFALGLEHKLYTPASMLSDIPREFVHQKGNYFVSNYDDRYLGPILYRKALANSRNIPAIEVLERVGIDETFNFFKQLGLVHANQPAQHYGVGLAIGGLYVTLEDLIQVYGMLANEGKAFQLRWFEEAAPSIEERYLSEATARQLALFLSDPSARLPSFPRMGALEHSFPVAIKTGTSQGFRDAWALAYSSKFVVGVWMGHPQNDSMKHVNGLASAEIVKTLMEFLHPQETRGVAEFPFPPPRDFKGVRLCSLSGELAGDNCPETVIEYFYPGTEPVTYFQSQAALAVNERTGGFAVHITFPSSGSRFLLDPETPRSSQTIGLQAQTIPEIAQVLWKVDGEVFDQTPYPYETRLPLSPGTHTIQAFFPHAHVASNVVTIHVVE